MCVRVCVLNLYWRLILCVCEGVCVCICVCVCVMIHVSCGKIEVVSLILLWQNVAKFLSR